MDASVRAAEAELIREYTDVKRIIQLLDVLQSDMNMSEANESVEACLKNQPDASPVRIRYPNVTKFYGCGTSGLSDFLTTRFDNFSYEELLPKGNGSAVRCAGGAGESGDADPLGVAKSNPPENKSESQPEAPNEGWKVSGIVQSGPYFETTTQSWGAMGVATSRGFVDNISVRVSNVQLPSLVALIGPDGKVYEIRIANGAISVRGPGDDTTEKVILNPADRLTLQVEPGGVVKAYLNTLVMHTFSTTESSWGSMRARFELQGVGAKLEVVESPVVQWKLTNVQQNGKTII